jgi:ornithine carbamoyltransferase
MIAKQYTASDFGAKKNCISLLGYSEDEIDHLLTMALSLKRARDTEERTVSPLSNKTGVLIFEKPSLRTHISFETALFELGAHSIVLPSNMIQMGKRETVRDVAKNLERLVHLIVARTYLHETIVELAMHSSIPVINALSDKYHPCQALAFALTMLEHRGKEKKINVVFIGDGNNVCHSIMVLCAKRGYHFTAACPSGYEPDRDVWEACAPIARRNGGSVAVTADPVAAVAQADVVYTDVWASMGQENEAEERKKRFAAFQVNASLLQRAPADVLVSHCLPAHRGEEITSDVLDSEASVALDEAENRLHVQKAIIVHLFS